MVATVGESTSVVRLRTKTSLDSLEDAYKTPPSRIRLLGIHRRPLPVNHLKVDLVWQLRFLEYDAPHSLVDMALGLGTL